MMYVLGVMWAILAGFVSGWLMYNASAGTKKDRIKTAILWGVGMAIISFLCAFSA